MGADQGRNTQNQDLVHWGSLDLPNETVGKEV